MASREQILAAATRAFARAGLSATSLDDIAAEAHVTRAIIYRHFDSKTELYRAVLHRANARLAAAAGEDFTFDTIGSLLDVAAEDPDGFRLLFRYAGREPEFNADIDRMRAGAVAIARQRLADLIPDPAWVAWASELAPTVAIEAVIAWLDAGQLDRREVMARIQRVLAAVVDFRQRE